MDPGDWEYENETIYDYSNFTYEDVAEPCLFEKVHRMQITRMYLHSVVCFLGLVGNILVIITYALYKRGKSIMDVYLLNIAIANFVFAVTLPIMIYNEQHDWVMGNLACKTLRCMYSINLFSGMLLLACISIHLYITIVQARRSYGLHFQVITNNKIFCIAIWVVAIGLSIPIFISSKTFTAVMDTSDMNYHDDLVELGNGSQQKHAVCHLFTEHKRTVGIMLPITLVVVFLGSLSTMGFCYISIVGTPLRAKAIQQRKVAPVLLGITIVFVACHLPYNTVLIYYNVTMFNLKTCYEAKALEISVMVTESLAYLHCCLNPIMLIIFGPKFRRHFIQIFSCGKQRPSSASTQEAEKPLAM